MRECIEPSIFVAGKTIAATLIDLLMQSEELGEDPGRVQRQDRGGVGGTDWVAPLLSSDFPPPVDLRWPEYVQTTRGEEWWIPTPDD